MAKLRCGLAWALCLLASACGSGIPVSYTFSVDLGSGYGMESPAGLEPGAPLPADFVGPAAPVCVLPSRQDIREMVRETAGGFVAEVFQLDHLYVKKVVLTAESGDFSTLTGVSVYWNPSLTGWPGYDPIELGAASEPDGFGAEIVLTPPDRVDFLKLLDQEKAGGAFGCPSLDMALEGRVPETLPTLGARAVVCAEGRLGP